MAARVNAASRKRGTERIKLNPPVLCSVKAKISCQNSPAKTAGFMAVFMGI